MNAKPVEQLTPLHPTPELLGVTLGQLFGNAGLLQGARHRYALRPDAIDVIDALDRPTILPLDSLTREDLVAMFDDLRDPGHDVDQRAVALAMTALSIPPFDQPDRSRVAQLGAIEVTAGQDVAIAHVLGEAQAMLTKERAFVSDALERAARQNSYVALRTCCDPKTLGIADRVHWAVGSSDADRWRVVSPVPVAMESPSEATILNFVQAAAQGRAHACDGIVTQISLLTETDAATLAVAANPRLIPQLARAKGERHLRSDALDLAYHALAQERDQPAISTQHRRPERESQGIDRSHG